MQHASRFSKCVSHCSWTRDAFRPPSYLSFFFFFFHKPCYISNLVDTIHGKSNTLFTSLVCLTPQTDTTSVPLSQLILRYSKMTQSHMHIALISYELSCIDRWSAVSECRYLNYGEGKDHVALENETILYLLVVRIFRERKAQFIRSDCIAHTVKRYGYFGFCLFYYVRETMCCPRYCLNVY